MRKDSLDWKNERKSAVRLGTAGLAALLVAFGAVVACGDDEEGVKPTVTADSGPTTTDSGTDTSTCAPEPPRTCTAKKCTQDLGEPAVCVKDACVKLKSPECPNVFGPADDDNALVFGAVHDLFGGQKVPGQAGMNAQELAIKEINDKGGLRDPDRCKPSRPLVLVGCNDSNINPDGTAYVAPDGGTELNRQQRMVEHLAGELDVPIITGGTTSGTSLAINNYMMPKYKKLYLTTRSTSPIFENPTTFNASPDGTRLFWRTTGNAKGQTAAMKKVLEQMADAVKTKYTLNTVKVALVVKNDAFGIGTADALEQGLTVNGQPAGSTSSNPNYIRLDYRERPGTGLPTQPEQDVAVDQLKTFQPDIIIFISTDEFVAGTIGVNDPHNIGIMKPYEDYVRANNIRKPFYLHSHASISNAFTAYLNNFANFNNDAAIRKDFLERTRGTNLSEPTVLAQAFFNRYKGVFQTPTESIYGMPEAYDATYVAAYLFAATFWKGPVTSEALAKAFPSLVEGGNSVDNGPTAFNAAVQALTTGGKVNYNGAVSPLDWDYNTGEAPYNSNVWCVQVNQTTNTLFYQQNAGQIWRYQSGQLEGNYNCPQ